MGVPQGRGLLRFRSHWQQNQEKPNSAVPCSSAPKVFSAGRALPSHADVRSLGGRGRSGVGCFLSSLSCRSKEVAMRWLKGAIVLAALGVGIAQVASARVPAFVRQTGLVCNQCHVATAAAAARGTCPTVAAATAAAATAAATAGDRMAATAAGMAVTARPIMAVAARPTTAVAARSTVVAAAAAVSI
jgi:hypothetical protein